MRRRDLLAKVLDHRTKIEIVTRVQGAVRMNTRGWLGRDKRRDISYNEEQGNQERYNLHGGLLSSIRCKMILFCCRLRKVEGEKEGLSLLPTYYSFAIE